MIVNETLREISLIFRHWLGEEIYSEENNISTKSSTMSKEERQSKIFNISSAFSNTNGYAPRGLLVGTFDGRRGWGLMSFLM